MGLRTLVATCPRVLGRKAFADVHRWFQRSPAVAMGRELSLCATTNERAPQTCAPWLHGGALRPPTDEQVIAVAGSWDAALRLAGLAASAPRPGRVRHVVLARVAVIERFHDAATGLYSWIGLRGDRVVVSSWPVWPGRRASRASRSYRGTGAPGPRRRVPGTRSGRRRSAAVHRQISATARPARSRLSDNRTDPSCAIDWRCVTCRPWRRMSV